jgi:aspartyl-tRNA(Asn)/glutamyl-tRNA(Gln) amidotransferase subunit A
VSELAWLPALELRERYRRRELSPVEVTGAVLDRIDALNPSLTAFVTVTADLARRLAREVEAAYASGDADRPLLGVPVSIKDLVATKGIRTTSGSLLHRDRVPDYDDPIVERVYDAGAVLLGKTNLGESGWKGDSGNRVVGPTHNPWRHGRTAGGSSGGAGAAVAAGLGPLAQGGDASGSIRMPAAFCGIFGLKTSFGAIPYFPPSGVEALAVRGPMTRTVRDAALFMDVLAGPDELDRNSFLSPEVDYLASVEGGVEGLRVAWSPDLGYAQVEPAVAELAAAAARVFEEELGCSVEEVTPPFPDPYPIIDTIRGAGSAAAYDDLDAVRAELDPGRLAWIEHSLRLTGAQVGRAEAERARYGHELRQFLAPYALLLTPTLPVTAFEAGADGPPGFDRADNFLQWASFSYPFNLSGQPAATVPCGLVDGLPVGLQIVGRFREDAIVLRAAAAFEAARPWAHLRPPL